MRGRTRACRKLTIPQKSSIDKCDLCGSSGCMSTSCKRQWNISSASGAVVSEGVRSGISPLVGIPASWPLHAQVRTASTYDPINPNEHVEASRVHSSMVALRVVSVMVFPLMPLPPWPREMSSLCVNTGSTFCHRCTGSAAAPDMRTIIAGHCLVCVLHFNMQNFHGK